MEPDVVDEGGHSTWTFIGTPLDLLPAHVGPIVRLAP